MMLTHPVARVYAEALFDLARERSVPEEVARELEEFRALVRREPELESFLVTPVIEPGTKIERLKRALSGRMSDLVTDFLCLIVERRRFAMFGRIVDAVRTMADEHAGRVRVSVRSAAALSDPLRRELESALEDRLKRTIEIEAQTDPQLMGGAVVRVGDRVWDGSLKARLNGFRKQLVRS